MRSTLSFGLWCLWLYGLVCHGLLATFHTGLACADFTHGFFAFAMRGSAPAFGTCDIRQLYFPRYSYRRGERPEKADKV
ncbi:hypothetical protein XFEB_00243 [Xylella fastidiosa EB92.1]|nr:hypothetical protein XFEB_00243 [Xylella fastidiosa EB92.1]